MHTRTNKYSKLKTKLRYVYPLLSKKLPIFNSLTFNEIKNNFELFLMWYHIMLNYIMLNSLFSFLVLSWVKAADWKSKYQLSSDGFVLFWGFMLVASRRAFIWTLWRNDFSVCQNRWSVFCIWAATTCSPCSQRPRVWCCLHYLFSLYSCNHHILLRKHVLVIIFEVHICQLRLLL